MPAPSFSWRHAEALQARSISRALAWAYLWTRSRPGRTL